MTDFVEIKNTEFIRDMNSKAVINTDVDGLRRYQQERKKILEQKKHLKSSEQRIDKLEKDIDEIKNLLYKILSKEDN